MASLTNVVAITADGATMDVAPLVEATLGSLGLVMALGLALAIGVVVVRVFWRITRVFISDYPEAKPWPSDGDSGVEER